MKDVGTKASRCARLSRSAVKHVGFCATGLSLMAASMANAAASDIIARSLSRTEIAEKSEWRKYVLNVKGAFVPPAKVEVEGDATAILNPNGLLGRGGTTITTKKAHSARIVVDLGVLASGFVELGVRSASGAPIRLAYSEDRSRIGLEGDASTDPKDFFYLGRTLAAEDNPDGRADVFAPPSSETVLVSPGLRGAQRYVAITLDGPGTATLNFVRVRQTNYSGQYDGHFVSSDERLNKAWYASAYGLDLSTVRDLRKAQPGPWVIVDGPKRDRVAYAGDLELVALAAYAQGQAYFKFVRDTLNLFACRQNDDGTVAVVGMPGEPCPIGDPGASGGVPKGYLPAEALPVRLDTFTGLWVVALADYVRFTGDKSYAATVMPVARKAVKFFTNRLDSSGLWSSKDYDGKLAMNWHTPDKATGVGGYDNQIYYRALTSLAALERGVASDEAEARRLESHAAKLHGILLNKFWDPKAGAMLLNLEDPKRDHSADSNAVALRWGLLDASRARQAIAFLRDRLRTPYGIANSEHEDNPYMARYISPYIQAQAAMGMFRYGSGQDALDLIRTSWTYMIERGSGVPWEEMSVTGTPIVPRPGTPLNAGTDIGLSHAWSTAVPALSTYVLGVQPISDGYRTWSVAPQPVDLEWAQGRVPTPHGAIAVRWKRMLRDDSFVLSVAAPSGTKGAVRVPILGKARTIAMNGKIVWANGRPSPGVKAVATHEAVTFEGVRGVRTFAWAK